VKAALQAASEWSDQHTATGFAALLSDDDLAVTLHCTGCAN